jgi:hypothetical protein
LKEKNEILERFGFSFERGCVHTARTIMLNELQMLLCYVASESASIQEYKKAIVEDNCLLKRSGRNRDLTFRHLADLYILEPGYLLFRALRYFWYRDTEGRSLLALLCACATDSLLRNHGTFILGLSQGTTITSQDSEAFIEQNNPGRFSPATLRSTAQNINSSFTQSGHLSGRSIKKRTKVYSSPGSTAYALLLGYLTGARGESLFSTDYAKLLDSTPEEMSQMAVEASGRGWMVFKRIGNVVEVAFPNLLTEQEMEWVHGQA